MIFTPFTTLILGIWALATIGCAFTKNSDPYALAFFATCCIGLGYYLLKV